MAEGDRKAKSPAARPTMEDIARLAQVSKPTVSRVLNNSPLVTDATKERVRKIIEELDYHPNVVARSLRSSKSRLLLALVPNISNPFHAEIVHGTNRVVHAHDEDDLCGARAGRAMVISAHTTRC